jgi:hypothetical protein
MSSNSIAGALLIILAGFVLAFTPASSEEGHWIPSQTEPVWPGQSLPLASTTQLARTAKAVRATKLPRMARAVRAKKLARTVKLVRATQLARTARSERATQLIRTAGAARVTKLVRTAITVRVTQPARAAKRATQLARVKKSVPTILARETPQRARIQDDAPESDFIAEENASGCDPSHAE